MGGDKKRYAERERTNISKFLFAAFSLLMCTAVCTWACLMSLCMWIYIKIFQCFFSRIFRIMFAFLFYNCYNGRLVLRCVHKTIEQMHKCAANLFIFSKCLCLELDHIWAYVFVTFHAFRVGVKKKNDNSSNPPI